ncbi:hypothetical protein DY000_02028819 [Brassica cretica]|uniref:Glycosyl transferase CAP10 domain-containing protein n=1 Tax=Brassica cretica TaxID=69181 RepID=A0ABQ7DEC5_BRACR|nr:hypothetical protein DY000_02028819 [Brassica cretica]
MVQRKSTKRNNSDTQTNHVFIKTVSYQGKRIAKATLLLVFSIFISSGLLRFLGCFDFTTLAGLKQVTTTIIKPPIKTLHRFPRQCGVVQNQTQPVFEPRHSHSRPSTCPSYFRWIHEDLRPWRETGVTRGMLEKARRKAHFRVIIIDGRVYVKKYRRAIETRDTFTLWGIVQLLQWYPGRLPDLELLFDADDRPTVRSSDYRGQQHPAPPPVFRYCSNDANLDIVFPDWSFWGWAELNIKPWAKSLVAIEEGNKMTQWEDRVPYAYWRGNPNVARTRRDLLRCNVSDQEDWDTRLYINDWATEFKEGFKNSNLENQCTHRYKIYIEGWAWSVSEKYIMACDSMTLYVRPTYYDFLIRGMVPLQHYWPIRDRGKCRSLKHAVHWGNTHLDQLLLAGGRIKLTPIFTRNTFFTIPKKTLTTPFNFTLQCTLDKNITTQTCPASYPEKWNPKDDPETCPDYFRWIHKDLEPWRETGITRETLERARDKAHFRLIIKGGRVYVHRNMRSFQTRDVFITIWGILQLLRMYPGQVPDLELLFQCHDLLQIWRRDYRPRRGVNVTWPPPPVFHYCGHDGAFDIVFPDWSFWGWPEINIKEWNKLSKAISEGIKKVKWEERKPYAYWKGNPGVARIRRDLMRYHDPMIHLIHQDFKSSRSMHPQAKTIGRNGSGYVLKNLQMKHVYDYMFHILQSYGKLMKMNVEVPEGAKEGSCEMPPPSEEDELKKFIETKKSVEKEVEKWTNEYWEEQKKSLQH